MHYKLISESNKKICWETRWLSQSEADDYRHSSSFIVHSLQKSNRKPNGPVYGVR